MQNTLIKIPIVFWVDWPKVQDQNALHSEFVHTVKFPDLDQMIHPSTVNI